MLDAIYRFACSRISWAMLLVLVSTLLVVSLGMQHLAGLAPCAMCIHERMSVLEITVGAAIAFFNPLNGWYRLVGYAYWGYGSVLGLSVSHAHVAYQTDTSIFKTCMLPPSFPSYLPLDSIMPWFFSATGSCDDIIMVLGLSVPEWLRIIFGLAVVALSVVLIAEARTLMKPRPRKIFS